MTEITLIYPVSNSSRSKIQFLSYPVLAKEKTSVFTSDVMETTQFEKWLSSQTSLVINCNSVLTPVIACLRKVPTLPIADWSLNTPNLNDAKTSFERMLNEEYPIHPKVDANNQAEFLRTNTLFWAIPTSSGIRIVDPDGKWIYLSSWIHKLKSDMGYVLYSDDLDVPLAINHKFIKVPLNLYQIVFAQSKSQKILLINIINFDNDTSAAEISDNALTEVYKLFTEQGFKGSLEDIKKNMTKNVFGNWVINTKKKVESYPPLDRSFAKLQLFPDQGGNLLTKSVETSKNDLLKELTIDKDLIKLNLISQEARTTYFPEISKLERSNNIPLNYLEKSRVIGKDIIGITIINKYLRSEEINGDKFNLLKLYLTQTRKIIAIAKHLDLERHMIGNWKDQDLFNSMCGLIGTEYVETQNILRKDFLPDLMSLRFQQVIEGTGQTKYFVCLAILNGINTVSGIRKFLNQNKPEEKWTKERISGILNGDTFLFNLYNSNWEIL